MAMPSPAADTRSRSRDAIRARALRSDRPRHIRGRREDRALAAPMARVQKKARGRTTGLAKHAQPSLRDGFTAYT
jgi:hypothetical protein